MKLIGSNKPSGSGIFPPGKDGLVSPMIRRRCSFANGSTLAGLVALGMSLETAVNSRLVVAVGWRAAGSISRFAVREWVTSRGLYGMSHRKIFCISRSSHLTFTSRFHITSLYHGLQAALDYIIKSCDFHTRVAYHSQL